MWISVLNRKGAGLTVSLEIDALGRMKGAVDAIKKPSYDRQKEEVLRWFKRYLKRPNYDLGVQTALLGYYALCALAPDIPTTLSDVIRRCGSGCVTILVNPRRRILVGTISETVPDTEELTDLLTAAQRTPMRGQYSAANGWNSLPIQNHR